MTGQSSTLMPLVSVVTVSLNSGRYLEEAIKSVIGQTYRNIEYIIIDGGSVDETLNIIRKYEDRLAYWNSEPDRGLYDAMNKGVIKAEGELVGILNSDDWYQPQAVEAIVSGYLKDKEAGVFFGDIEIISNDLKYRQRVSGKPEEIGTYRWRVTHPSSFVKRKLYQRCKYDLRYKISADFDFFLKLYTGGVKFHYCPYLITWVRSGGKSGGYQTLVEEYKIRNRYFGPKIFLSNTGQLLTLIIKKFMVQNIFGDNLNHGILRLHRRLFHHKM